MQEKLLTPKNNPKEITLNILFPIDKLSSFFGFLRELLFSFGRGLLLLSALTFLGDESCGASGNLSGTGAVDVTIPRYGPAGNILWTLKAEQVTPSDSSTYDVTAPNLNMRNSANGLSHAKSEFGIFDINHGKAWGETTLEVRGDGYLAKGKNWSWNEKTEVGSHQMTFTSEAYVHFMSDLDPILKTSNGVSEKIAPKRSLLNKTIAKAEIIEFLSVEKEGYRFFLDGNVVVKGQGLGIECQKMEILVESDSNGSDGGFGKISKVNAFGKVRLDQIGRTCYADTLTLDTVEGKGLLEGNARVEDKDWGVVVGERVELDRETGKAKVIGDENERASIEFKNLGEIRLPGLKKSKSKSK